MTLPIIVLKVSYFSALPCMTLSAKGPGDGWTIARRRLRSDGHADAEEDRGFLHLKAGARVVLNSSPPPKKKKKKEGLSPFGCPLNSPSKRVPSKIVNTALALTNMVAECHQAVPPISCATSTECWLHQLLRNSFYVPFTHVQFLYQPLLPGCLPPH